MMDLMIRIQRRVLARLAEKANTVAANLAGGQAKNFDEYKMSVGRIQGMKDAEDIFNEVFKEVSDD
jgi:hypothetical protein